MLPFGKPGFAGPRPSSTVERLQRRGRPRVTAVGFGAHRGLE